MVMKWSIAIIFLHVNQIELGFLHLDHNLPCCDIPV
jgi:hypothetical protein